VKPDAGRSPGSRAAGLLAGAALFVLALLPMGEGARAEVRVTAFKGEVGLLRAGAAREESADRNSRLATGDRLRTGRDGWAALALPDGSRIMLTSDSDFLVRDFDGARHSGIFSLLNGKLRASIRRQAEQSADYRFHTRTAVAGIRGTDFALIHRGQANVFFGNAGLVDVRGLETGGRQLVPDTVVQTTRGMTPVEPIAIERDSDLARARRVLNEVTEQPPASWAEANQLANVIARWNINYSRYLADAGRRDEALHILQVAMDLSDDVGIQADARLQLGAVHGRDPAGAESALAAYAPLLDLPLAMPQRETALYMTGKVLFQLGRTGEALDRLGRYLRDYPAGRHAASAATLARMLEAGQGEHQPR
jgi:tetratricopeptide (TPR) repeat protein